MLGAWQLGDVEKLHAHYADDVDVVNGTWAPPVVGWPNYLMSYQSQRARTQQVRMDRSNTLVRLAPSPAIPPGPAISGNIQPLWMEARFPRSGKRRWCSKSATMSGSSCITILP